MNNQLEPEAMQLALHQIVCRVLGDTPAVQGCLPDTPFAHIGADACDHLLITMAIEDYFNVSIEEERLLEVSSIASCINLLKKV